MVLPENFPSLTSLFHPLYHGMLLETSDEISENRFSLYGGSVESILLTPMISCLTPRGKAKRACSRVWPFLEIPASNSPTPAATIRTAQSAWEVPVIMFLMKSR